MPGGTQFDAAEAANLFVQEEWAAKRQDPDAYSEDTMELLATLARLRSEVVREAAQGRNKQDRQQRTTQTSG